VTLCGYSREEILGRTIEELNFCDSPNELIDALEQVRTAQTVAIAHFVFAQSPDARLKRCSPPCRSKLVGKPAFFLPFTA
jgi:hypothetical protein